jgi:hypothetical protein
MIKFELLFSIDFGFEGAKKTQILYGKKCLFICFIILYVNHFKIFLSERDSLMFLGPFHDFRRKFDAFGRILGTYTWFFDKINLCWQP